MKTILCLASAGQNAANHSHFHSTTKSRPTLLVLALVVDCVRLSSRFDLTANFSGRLFGRVWFLPVRLVRSLACTAFRARQESNRVKLLEIRMSNVEFGQVRLCFPFLCWLCWLCLVLRGLFAAPLALFGAAYANGSNTKAPIAATLAALPAVGADSGRSNNTARRAIATMVSREARRQRAEQPQREPAQTRARLKASNRLSRSG